jgi:hypothetical protein
MAMRVAPTQTAERDGDAIPIPRFDFAGAARREGRGGASLERNTQAVSKLHLVCVYDASCKNHSIPYQSLMHTQSLLSRADSKMEKVETTLHC